MKLWNSIFLLFVSIILICSCSKEEIEPCSFEDWSGVWRGELECLFRGKDLIYEKELVVDSMILHYISLSDDPCHVILEEEFIIQEGLPGGGDFIFEEARLSNDSLYIISAIGTISPSLFSQLVCSGPLFKVE